MRGDLENVFGVLPFGNDIKHTIYTQLYRHLYAISPQLKQDLQTYLLLNEVICTYQAELATDYMDQNYFLYSLYNDLLFNEHDGEEYNDDAGVIRNDNHDNSLYLYNRVRNIAALRYPIVLERIKYFWRLLNPKRRLCFIKFMEIKFKK